MMLKPTAAKGRTHRTQGDQTPKDGSDQQMLTDETYRRWQLYSTGSLTSTESPSFLAVSPLRCLHSKDVYCKEALHCGEGMAKNPQIHILCFTSIEAASFSYCRRYCIETRTFIIFPFNLFFFCNISSFLPVKLLYLSHFR